MNRAAEAVGPNLESLVAELADQFTDEVKRGLSPDVEVYARKHPEVAAIIRQVFPALAVLDTSSTSSAIDESESGDEHPADGILGDFRIMREIGRGGMGVVYEAEQISLRRRVALKVLPFAAMLDKQQLARFKNEARAAATLDHANIVAIHSVGAERGVHYYAMQLIEGRSLAEIIAAMKPGLPPSAEDATAPYSKPSTAGDTAKAALPTVKAGGSAAFSSIPAFESREYFKTVARLGIQAAEALDHAHQNGILHRDIKPANLMVDDAGKLWVTDFGLARIEQDAGMTMTGDLLGTLRYMSPEHALAKRVVVDNRSDIYSLGATLYELLALRPAFAGEDRQELLRQIAFDEPRKPREFNPRIPIDLETIICKSIEKNPADRYATAQDLVEDLKRFVEQVPIKARRPSWTDRGRKWVARHAAMTAMACGCFALLAVTACVGAFFISQAYNAESKQRAEAEANLSIAARAIDRVLSRTSDHEFWRGDLKRAEALVTDSTSFYEELLKRSDDADLQYHAARAYGNASDILELVGQYEKAESANQRAQALLQDLTDGFPDRPEYADELASTYNRVGVVEWDRNQRAAAEQAWQRAVTIWSELARRFPNKPEFQDAVAQVLANIGVACFHSDRFDEAEEYYRRARAINNGLPDEIRNSPKTLASQAGLLVNEGEVARHRGQYDRALKLFQESVSLYEKALEKWPTNRVALDGFYTCCWCIVEVNLSAAHHAEAAAAVEQFVTTFPDRLAAYNAGAKQLLRCAKLVESSRSEPRNDRSRDRDKSEDAELYRRRAHELVANAHDAHDRTPDAVDQFAMFLLICEDKSFRDPERALVLAKNLTEEVPQRADAWFTLALAQYRSRNWQAADEADQNSIKYSPSGEANAFDWLLLSMIRAQQGRIDEARQWHAKAVEWMEQRRTKNDDLTCLRKEAEELLDIGAPKR